MIGAVSSHEDAAMIKVWIDEAYQIGAPMFTQQHYIAIAEVIHQRRLKIKKSELEHNHRDSMLSGVSDLTKDLIDLFKKDNAKFNPLLFIAASSKDLA